MDHFELLQSPQTVHDQIDLKRDQKRSENAVFVFRHEVGGYFKKDVDGVNE